MSDIPRFRPGRWGYLQVSPMRYGTARFRLVVLAPGSTLEEYRLMRFGDASMSAAVAVWTLSLAILMPPIGPTGGEVESLLIAFTIASITGWTVHRSARRVRRTAREVDVHTELFDCSPVAAAAERANALMCVADDLREQHTIDAIEYELLWNTAWQLLPLQRNDRLHAQRRAPRSDH